MSLPSLHFQAQLVAWLERNEPKAAAWRATMSEGQQVEWQRVAPGADALAQQTLDTQVHRHLCLPLYLCLSFDITA